MIVLPNLLLRALLARLHQEIEVLWVVYSAHDNNVQITCSASLQRFIWGWIYSFPSDGAVK